MTQPAGAYPHKGMVTLSIMQAVLLSGQALDRCIRRTHAPLPCGRWVKIARIDDTPVRSRCARPQNSTLSIRRVVPSRAAPSTTMGSNALKGARRSERRRTVM
jgi:hypothetical protein